MRKFDEEHVKRSHLIPVRYTEAINLIQKETQLKPSAQLRLALKDFFIKHKDIVPEEMYK